MKFQWVEVPWIASQPAHIQEGCSHQASVVEIKILLPNVLGDVRY